MPGSKTENDAMLKMSAGALSGLTQTFLFSPWDRALYLSMKDNVAFLDRRNWVEPFRGCTQALAHRTCTTGMWRPLLDVMLPPARRLVGPGQEPTARLLAGNGAGVVNGLALNWISAAKYQMWTNEGNFWETVARMWRQGGVRPFVRGLTPTVGRDAVFGGVFMSCRHWLATVCLGDPDGRADSGSRVGEVAVTVTAGAMATVASGPLNYARNMQYATPASEQSRTTASLIRELFAEAAVEPRPVQFLTSRLRLGWGTMRVAVGMGVGFELYRFFQQVLQYSYSSSM